MINSLDEGRILSEQGATENVQLVLVLTGSLKVSQDAAADDDDDENGEERWLALVQPREIVGGLELLTNEPCFFTTSAAAPVRCVRSFMSSKCSACFQSMIAALSARAFAEIVEARPRVWLAVAVSVMRRLSTFVRAVDFASESALTGAKAQATILVDWMLVDSGKSNKQIWLRV